ILLAGQDQPADLARGAVERAVGRGLQRVDDVVDALLADAPRELDVELRVVAVGDDAHPQLAALAVAGQFDAPVDGAHRIEGAGPSRRRGGAGPGRSVRGPAPGTTGRASPCGRRRRTAPSRSPRRSARAGRSPPRSRTTRPAPWPAGPRWRGGASPRPRRGRRG